MRGSGPKNTDHMRHEKLFSYVFSTEELATTMSLYAKPIVDGKLVHL